MTPPDAAPGATDPTRSAIRPPSLTGFDHVTRFHDPRRHTISAKILPGEYYVTTDDELITTVLGSCVSACVWDPEAAIGGMNHFMLPEGGGRSADGAAAGGPGLEPARYGIYAMEFLINTVLANGGARSRLRVKLAGGGQVVPSATAIGETNVEFARHYVRREGLDLVGEHLGGPNARRLLFRPRSGQTSVLELSTDERREVVDREQRYASSVNRGGRQASGSVELF